MSKIVRDPTSLKRAKKIGLTGGIGSGKTTAAKLFQKQGIPYLDADVLARKLREPGGLAEPLIQKRFGTLDRAELRELISQDPVAKKDLEGILHPLIQYLSEKELNHLAATHPDAPFVLYEASLLIEAGRADDFDALILVTAPESDRIQRVMTRDQCSLDLAKRMISSQNSDQKRLELAHLTKHTPPSIHVIENLGNLLDLEQKVRKVLDQLKQA